MELSIGVCDGDVSRVALVGILDLVAVGQIETRLMAATVAHGRHTIVDLSGLTFIASLGMGILVTAYKGLKRKGAKLVLLNPQADVEAALVAARLAAILPIARGEAEALQYLTAD
ncbi:MAG TPA: STAS domain-containing protein [Pirellulales bacterium]|nr:STAS domain-containing protein [Pirellulales bacterium]